MRIRLNITALPTAPLGVLANRKFFRSMTKGLILRSARLLDISSLGECVLTLFGRRTETLALRKAQCLHEHVHTTLKLRNTSALSLKFLIFRPGNSNGFRGACLERICLFRGMIIPYKCRKVQKNDPFYTISNPLICLCAFGWSMLSPSMSQRYCCMVRALASLSFRGHWKMPDSKRL